MRSQLSERLGVAEPQIVHLPPDVHSLAAAEEAIELADAYGVCSGFPLDESQRFTLRAALGERVDGSWAAATVGDFEPRQNGKNDTIAARELAGLVLFGEQLIIHTAHEFSTANESFLRLVAVFEAWDDLRARVARIRYANGEQGIEFLSGQRLKYRARTGGAGRGFAKADLVVYDEAQHVRAEHVAASGPARLAKTNSQSWYSGSGGLSSSEIAWRMRRRALIGEAGRFAYVEHTAEDIEVVHGEIVSTRPDVFDREAWARANAAYGSRITDESMLSLYGELGEALFARECLCVWDAEPDTGERVIPSVKWEACLSSSVAPQGTPTFGIGVHPDREWASIAMADVEGRVELIDHRQGTGWLIGRVAELVVKTGGRVALDPGGPAGGLMVDKAANQIRFIEVGGRAFGQACAAFFDDVIEGRAAVRPHADLDHAVARARKRSTGDTWVWARKDPAADISPLEAVTLACWAAKGSKELPAPFFVYT